MSSKQLQPLDFFFFYSYRYRLPIIPFSPTYLSRSQVIINSSKQSCSFWAFSFLIRGISGYCYRNGNTGIEIHQIKLINFESLRNNCSLFFFFYSWISISKCLKWTETILRNNRCPFFLILGYK